MKRDDIVQAYNLKRDLEHKQSELRNAKGALDRLPFEIEEIETKLRALGVE